MRADDGRALPSGAIIAGSQGERVTVVRTSFVGELRRRNVHRAAVFYAGAAWLFVQIATQVFPFFEIPNSTVRVVVISALIGFPFALLFSWFYEWTPQGIVRESAVDRSESVTRETGKKLDKAIIAVLSLAVGLLLLNQFVLHRFMPGGDTASVPAGEKSIAVLPLVNSTGDPANEYFADGISEELIATLAHLGRLKVIGRTSSFQFKAKEEDSRAIGEKLGVGYLLEGSVRKSDQRVRISVELVNATDGASVWSETYDRDLKDIFALQSDIASAVATQLKVALLGGNAKSAEIAQSAEPASGNAEAYKALLQGRFYFARQTPQDVRKAIDYLETALTLDPDYALAHADLGFVKAAYATRYPTSETGPVDGLLASARASVDTALRLRPTLARAHAAHGALLAWLDLDFVAGAAEARRAVELDPQNAAMLVAQAAGQLSLGEFDASLATARRAIALDPLNAGAYSALAAALSSLGRYEIAESAARQVIELQPNSTFSHAQLAQIQVMRGDHEALATAQAEPNAFWRDYALAFAHARLGNTATSDAAMKRLIDCCSGTGSFQIASVYAARRDSDKAFEWLERARSAHDSGLSLLYQDLFVLELRGDPRFAAFATKIGLPPLRNITEEIGTR